MNRPTRKTLFGCVLCLILAGCSDSLEDQHANLENFVKSHKIGSSSDMWLMKHNAFGDWEKVTLIFGFMDDGEFCEDIAQLYMGKYPLDKFRCAPAN